MSSAVAVSRELRDAESKVQTCKDVVRSAERDRANGRPWQNEDNARGELAAAQGALRAAEARERRRIADIRKAEREAKKR